MNHDLLIDHLFEALTSGNRRDAITLVHDALTKGASAEDLIVSVLWPSYETIEKLHRNDQMTGLSHSMATRLLRVLHDQVAAGLTKRQLRGRRVFAVCGPTDADELAAQMAVDLLEAQGFEVAFAGGGIAIDEIQEHVQSVGPDVLLLFASSPSDLPALRGLIDSLNEVGAVRQLQVVVGGGVFNRAEGLAEEIGADLWARSPEQLVRSMMAEPARRASIDQHSVGRKRRKAA